jgi:hypothetical protein
LNIFCGHKYLENYFWEYVERWQDVYKEKKNNKEGCAKNNRQDKWENKFCKKKF